MKLIPNWKAALGHYSTLALGVAAAIPATWASVPDELKVLIPAKEMAIITAVVAAAGFFGKFVTQGTPKVEVPAPTNTAANDIASTVKAAVIEKGKDYVADQVADAIKKALK